MNDNNKGKSGFQPPSPTCILPDILVIHPNKNITRSKITLPITPASSHPADIINISTIFTCLGQNILSFFVMVLVW